MTKVKICGVTSVADAVMAAEAGADAIGLNFCPSSPRRVGVETAAAIAAALPRHVCRVGVFVDAPRDQIAAIAAQVGLDALQFHGTESVALCSGWDRKTIKAVRVPVKYGFNDGTNVEILEGIAENARVLIPGKVALVNGQAVNAVEVK